MPSLSELPTYLQDINREIKEKETAVEALRDLDRTTYMTYVLARTKLTARKHDMQAEGARTWFNLWVKCVDELQALALQLAREESELVGLKQKRADHVAPVKLAREVAVDESRLDLLDQAVEEEKTYLTMHLKRSSQLKEAMKYNKIHPTDVIEAMEKVEMATHRTALRLSAFSVERSRLVRVVMSKNAAIRKLRIEAGFYQEEDPDMPYEPNHLQKTWGKIHVCMGKKCVLEKHVEKEVDQEVAFVLNPGSKAEVDEEKLKSYRARSTLGDSVQYLDHEIEAIREHLATLNRKYDLHLRRYVEYSEKLCAAKSLLDGNRQFPIADSEEDIKTYENKLADWRVKRLDTLKSMAAYDYRIEAFKEKS
ncbi:hypothetical protein C7974DRAFT_411990 [Boeremia exigua]|uniref:uncharacterized protein n=1 Tax=Boeremia exigua TaxID=749465 RepID=UPI001E8D644E|nr:uncharacterized protein C7974DRAFT_411990 [Boeremia exigua]KAH6632961.1 hypothetical protein C7974DRAFT_411990 [Boeremia exigua]